MLCLSVWLDRLGNLSSGPSIRDRRLSLKLSVSNDYQTTLWGRGDMEDTESRSSRAGCPLLLWQHCEGCMCPWYLTLPYSKRTKAWRRLCRCTRHDQQEGA